MQRTRYIAFTHSLASRLQSLQRLVLLVATIQLRMTKVQWSQRLILSEAKSAAESRPTRSSLTCRLPGAKLTASEVDGERNARAAMPLAKRRKWRRLWLA